MTCAGTAFQAVCTQSIDVLVLLDLCVKAHFEHELPSYHSINGERVACTWLGVLQMIVAGVISATCTSLKEICASEGYAMISNYSKLVSIVIDCEIKNIKISKIRSHSCLFWIDQKRWIRHVTILPF